MLSAREKEICQSHGVMPDRCYGEACSVKLTRSNESSGMDYVDGELIAVPLCTDCSSARDYRAGVR